LRGSAAGAADAARSPGNWAEINAPAARQDDKTRKHQQLPIIVVVAGNGLSFDHEGGSDWETLRQTVELMA
jgi:predicted double-glycine peptidase